jgi:hypothetical protein
MKLFKVTHIDGTPLSEEEHSMVDLILLGMACLPIFVFFAFVRVLLPKGKAP